MNFRLVVEFVAVSLIAGGAFLVWGVAAPMFVFGAWLAVLVCVNGGAGGK